MLWLFVTTPSSNERPYRCVSVGLMDKTLSSWISLPFREVLYFCVLCKNHIAGRRQPMDHVASPPFRVLQSHTGASTEDSVSDNIPVMSMSSRVKLHPREARLLEMGRC